VKILARNFNIESVLMAVSPWEGVLSNRLHLLRRNGSAKRATTIDLFFCGLRPREGGGY
jgi:hypothetical protein